MTFLDKNHSAMVQETLQFKGLTILKEEENELVKAKTGCKLREYRISTGRASHSTRSLQLWASHNKISTMQN